MNTGRDSDPFGVSIGDMLAGRYSLQSPLEERPTLWQAHDEIEDRPVLLCFLSPELQVDPRAIEELRKQVELCRELDHPCLAGARELMIEPDAPAFLVLDDADGRTLASLQREQPQGVFTWEWLQPRVKQLGEGLQFAHEHRVTHGGVHPENILINRLGDARLLLGGVSTVLSHPLYSGTASQERLGYFSPQLLEGKPPAASDDVYALGVVVYQALSGTTPFYGGDLLSQIHNLPPASLEARLQELGIANPVPPAVGRFILAALSRNPDVRPADARVLGNLASPAAPLPPSALGAAGTPLSSRDAPASAPEEVVLPEPMAEGATESVTSGAQEGLEEVRRMRAAIQRDRRRRLTVGALVLGVVLTAAGVGFLPAVKQRLFPRKTHTAVQTLPVPLPGSGAAVSGKPQVSRTVAAPAPAAPSQPETSAPPPADPEQGFAPLFNGRDLTGWSGDTRHWLVREGMIVGRALPDDPPQTRFSLVSDQSAPDDFEIRFSFRCLAYKNNENPNGGVEYRATRLDSSRMKGYRYDIVRDPSGVGAMMDDHGRALLASHGDKVVADAAGGKDVLKPAGTATASNLVAAAFQREDWNEGVITARGNHLVHQLNGQVVADVVDENREKAPRGGLIALEIDLRHASNPATFIMFKDIRLTKLSSGSR
jgi:hypothetical protein